MVRMTEKQPPRSSLLHEGDKVSGMTWDQPWTGEVVKLGIATATQTPAAIVVLATPLDHPNGHQVVTLALPIDYNVESLHLDYEPAGKPQVVGCQNNHDCGDVATHAISITRAGKTGITMYFCFAGVQRLLRTFSMDPTRTLNITALNATDAEADL